ncbi:MAG TPA: hypothetical protein VGB35_02725, partial [Gammaproteobacteria bacterium]
MTHGYFNSVFIFTTLLVTTSCSTKVNYLISSMVDLVPSYDLKIDESINTSYYSFTVGEDASDMTLFFIPGSGCASLKYYFKPFFSELDGNIRIFAMQKRNLDNNSTGVLGCDKKFHRSNIFRNWVQDQKQFIDMMSNHADVEGKPIVLLGVSEGGNVAAAVAAASPNVTHLAILGSGGMKQIDELKLLFRNKRLKNSLDDVFSIISHDPDNIDKTAYGQTYKYWSSVVYVDPLAFYSKVDIPILVGIGESDKRTPVESAIYLRNYFSDS